MSNQVRTKAICLALGLFGLALAGCGNSDSDGGDPSKAPRVEEVKRPPGWVPPEQAMAEKHAAAKEKMKSSTDGEADGGK